MVILIILIIVLIVFSLFIKPFVKEPFHGEHNFAHQMEVGNDINKKRSTLLYFKNKKMSEEDYLELLREKKPFYEFAEPMIMNRCIEFIHDPVTYRFGLDQVITELYADQKMFVSDKIIVDYLYYDTIEEKLLSEILKLYARSNAGSNTVDQFIGPGYILMTQYPFIRDILEDCTIIPKALRNTRDHLPKPIDETTKCTEQATIIRNQVMRAEIYILLPLHTPKTIRTTDGKEYRIVGPNVYTRWEQVLTNMRRLFAYNSEGKSGVAVVNPRSFNKRCQLHCGTPSTNPYYFTCGARNHIVENNRAIPYQSVVLGGSKTGASANTIQKHDFANLYLINSKKMNLILGMHPVGGIFYDCDTISVEAISKNFDISNTSGMETCVQPNTSQSRASKNQLSEITKNTSFRIQLEHNCLSEKNKALSIMDCSKADYWYIEHIKENKEIVQIYILKNNKKWYLTKNRTRELILQDDIPTKTAFKRTSPNTLNMVNIDTDKNIEWDTHLDFCVSFTATNRPTLVRCSSFNEHIRYIPYVPKQRICKNYIKPSVKKNIIRIINRSLLKNEGYM